MNNKSQRLSKKIAPGIPVSLSHEIAPRMGEFERAVTTVINAYIGPVTDTYIRDLDNGLSSKGLTNPVQVVTSTGGASRATEMNRRAVSVVNSGPVAGLVAARFLGDQLGHSKIITADMGGTSFDVGLIDGPTLEEASFSRPRAPRQLTSRQIGHNWRRWRQHCLDRWLPTTGTAKRWSQTPTSCL